MPCNAWNHPIDCDCGFGGDGHLGGPSGAQNRDLGPYAYDVLSINTRSVGSYTDPNASCPVCGASVFFYQSPHGGRVFFDELGPPWPKHPCTDNHEDVRPPLRVRAMAWPWQAAGWSPLIVDVAQRIDGELVRLDCRFRGASLVLYLCLAIRRGVDEDQDLWSTSLIQAKTVDDTNYELSIVSGRSTRTARASTDRWTARPL